MFFRSVLVGDSNRTARVLFLGLSVFFLSVGAQAHSYLSFLQGTALEKKLHHEKKWILLGHYQKGLLSGYKSEADGSDFFLAPDGNGDPKAELLATLEGFFFQGPLKKDEQHPRCRFPARFRWLKEQLLIDSSQLPEVKCQRYEDYLARVPAQSVFIVFSSYYLNNPSSTFGHTLLRLGKYPFNPHHNKRHQELLDSGINYAANVSDDVNPVLYALGGVAGFFPGTFTNVPYFYKVREYNDYEARDIWSYELDLTRNETEDLVDHLWELGSTHFDYFFFTENCSYHILRALETAAPRLVLADHLPYWVIPSDTVRVLMQTPGLVKGIYYRPSVRSQFKARLKKLEKEEEEVLRTLVYAGKFSPIRDDFSKGSKARVYDALIDYLEFQNPEDMMEKTKSETKSWKQEVLLARAQLKVRSDALDIPPPEKEQPHRGHDSARVGMETGYEEDQEWFTQLNFRFALHDLLDPNLGHPKNAQIEFMNVKTRYQFQQEKLELDQVSLVKITSLAPLQWYKNSTSFRIDAGLKKFNDLNCDRCLGGLFEIGWGWTVESWNPDLFFFGLGELETSFAPGFSASNFRLGVGPRAGALYHFSDSFKGILQGFYRYYGFSFEPHYFAAETQFRLGLSKKVALNLRNGIRRSAWESAAGMFFYF